MDKKKLTEIFISVAIVAVVGFAITFFTGGFNESTTERDIEDFINNFDYTPGISDENGYESEFWNINFEADDKWTMFSASELEEMSEEIWEFSKTETFSSLKKSGMSDKVIDRILEGTYMRYETAAIYAHGDDFGVMQMMVTSSFDTKDTDIYAYVDGQIEASGLINVTTDKKTVAGTEFVTFEGDTSNDGMELHNVFLSAAKDGVFLTILCQYFEGSDIVYDSMLECISTYAE